MDKYIMVGCDLHDKTMLLKIAQGRGKAEKRTFGNDRCARKAMLANLKKRSRAAGGARVVFAYEASCQGFGLYDDVRNAGFECHVLAPTRIARSVKHRRNKTDEKDADRILEIVRGHVLAGNELPSVWVPDAETRDDREIVRARLDLAEKLTAVKSQIRMLLKRSSVQKPKGLGKKWTNAFRAWLLGLTAWGSRLSYGARVSLESLLRQMEALEEETRLLDEQIEALAETVRYAGPARELMRLRGVGLLTAMVYLTDMGDLRRFSNRKQIGSYIGLVPSSDESGEQGERKGHITHHGPERVRKALCQATWTRVRLDPEERAAYRRMVSRNPKQKKIAVVAIMRRLAVRMWHIGIEAQLRAGSFSEPLGTTVA